MAHELQIVEIFTEDDYISIKLRCRDCPDATFGISRWGHDPNTDDLVAEAQRQHNIDRFSNRRRER